MSQNNSNTLAMGDDPGKRLNLAKNFQPDVDLLLTEGLNAFGIPGSGKSNFVSLLCEQLARFSLPQLIIDTEGEYRRLINALPRGVLATANRCPSGYDILHKGLQVVMDLTTWHSEEAAALAICQLMNELFTVAGDLMQSGEPVPCPIHLDEAGYWLPQAQVDYLSKDTRRALYTVFQRLVNRGRKVGMVPFIYTQFISQINKDVIRRGGVLVLMRQSLDIDLKRYGEYIPDFDDERRETVRSFPRGRAAVVLPDGSCPVVTFDRCKTEHQSATPRARAAIAKFAGTSVDVTALTMRSMEQVEPVAVAAPAKERQAVVSVTEQRIRTLLVENPQYTPSQLSRRAHCSYTDAKKWLERIQQATTPTEEHAPVAAPTPITEIAPTPVAAPVSEERSALERVAAVLDAEPDVCLPELALRAKCPLPTAALCQQLVNDQKKRTSQKVALASSYRTVPDAYGRAFQVLDVNPACSIEDLSQRADCSIVTARICKEMHTTARK